VICAPLLQIALVLVAIVAVPNPFGLYPTLTEFVRALPGCVFFDVIIGYVNSCPLVAI
jgi:hypothetical protein